MSQARYFQKRYGDVQSKLLGLSLARHLRSSAWSRGRAAGVTRKMEERISGERIGKTGLLWPNERRAGT